MVRKIGLIIVLLVVSFISNAQVDPTDEVIGFDRSYYENIYQEEGLSKSEIDKLINEVRTFYLDKYYGKEKRLDQKSSSSLNSKTGFGLDPSNGSCINMGFEDGNFNGWCVTTGRFLGYSQTTGYNVTYDETLCDIGTGPIVDHDDGGGSQGDCAGGK